MPLAEGAGSGSLLEANDLQHAFGAVRVLRGLDLSLKAGEVLAVLGPNGAGKTTLLRILAGLLRPNAGEVRVMGRRLTPAEPETRRPLGLLSHQSLLYDDLSLLENLTFTARLYRLPNPRALARRALEEMELPAHDRPRNLSRGLLQRAAIARALLPEPRVLLLDEPFTGLDAASAERFRGLLRGQVASGRALVVVTHQMPETWDLTTQVGVLVAGRWAMQQPRPADPDAFLLHYRELARG